MQQPTKPPPIGELQESGKSFEDQSAAKTKSSNWQDWWYDDNFPFSAPWWLRYPASAGCFFLAYYSWFEWKEKGAWVVALVAGFLGLRLSRELTYGSLLAALAWLVLSALGAAVAALPVSVAIVIGAMIIADDGRR